MEKQRSLPISKLQKDLLVEFLQKHPELQSGRFTNEFTSKNARSLWEELSEILNSIAGGSSKDWRHWRKSWQDLKKNAKKKAVFNKINVNKTGGGGPVEDKISINEDKILDMICPLSIDGLSSVRESQIEFNFDELENRDETHAQEPQQILTNTGVFSIGNTEGRHMQEITENLDKTNFTCTLSPTPTPSTSRINKTPLKISKTKRLETSIKLSEELIKELNNRNHSIADYQDSKVDYLQHRREYETRKLEALEKNNEINEKILNVLTSLDAKLGEIF